MFNRSKESGGIPGFTITSSELRHITDPANFVGSGADSVCFVNPQTGGVLSIPYCNVMGKKSTVDMLYRIETGAFSFADDAIRASVNRAAIAEMDPEELARQINFSQRKLSMSVAKQNLASRELHEDPIVVVDRGINFYITSVQTQLVSLETPGNVVGKAMPFLGNEHPDLNVYPDLSRAIRMLQPDWHNNNAFLMQPDRDGFTPVVLIDF